jgi:hypothetical protein
MKLMYLLMYLPINVPLVISVNRTDVFLPPLHVTCLFPSSVILSVIIHFQPGVPAFDRNNLNLD